MSETEVSCEEGLALKLRRLRDKCRVTALQKALPDEGVTWSSEVAAGRIRPEWELAEDPRAPIRSAGDLKQLTASDLAWAAGLFVGEGYCGNWQRGDYGNVAISIRMLDERSVTRFALMFDRRVRSWPLHYDRTRLGYQVDAIGKTAEAILARLWPFIEGTDKGDQVKRVCEQVGVMGWVDGTATSPRPRRRGNKPRGPLSEETKRKIGAANKKRWAEKRFNA